MKNPRKLPVELFQLDDLTLEAEDRRVDGGDKKVSELASSMSESGMYHPLIVARRKSSGSPATMRLIDGKKRLAAARKLGWKEIKAIVIREAPGKTAPPGKWADLIGRLLRDELSDYDLARCAVEFQDSYGVKGSEFARQMGISTAYAYNLMRWYARVPEKIRNAWREQHPLINQKELERYSHLLEKDALSSWERRLAIRRSSITPFSPGGEENSATVTRRASTTQVMRLQEAIDVAPLLPSVKALCCDILRFVLGVQNHVPGITDYRKLPPAICSKERTA